MLITRRPIYRLNYNIIEILEFSYIEESFDNLNCGSNNRNSDFGDLLFVCDQRFITRRRIYYINYIFVKMLNNISIVEVYCLIDLNKIFFLQIFEKK